MKNNIILIGYMGCGKSTVGRSLAEISGMRFLDTDAWIEKKEGIAISEIFAKKGEPYFRELETECLKALLKEKTSESGVCEDIPAEWQGCVISVGGGLPVREENRKLLQQLGQVIYLEAMPDTIYERLKGDTARPLLQTEDPRQRIKEMLADREEKYLDAAHRVITVDGKTVADIIEEIIQNRSGGGNRNEDISN